MTPPWLVAVGLLVVCVSSIPVDLKFREASLQSQEVAANEEIAAISARIHMLQQVNRLAYDTTLFSRKLRWLIRKSLSGKPAVTDVQDLMKREVELSQAHVEVAVEGVADELKLEIKHGIIALQAGLDFVLQNYTPGTSAESDAAVAKIKANLAALEARFGVLNAGGSTGSASVATGGDETSSSAAPEAAVSSSAAAVAPESSSAAITESSSAAAAAAVESSTAQSSPPASGSTGDAVATQAPPATEPSTGGDEGTASTPPTPDTTTTNTPLPLDLASSSSALANSTSSSSGTEEAAAATASTL